MASPIEEYGLISDTETCALVSTTGSIDWFCVPRFDSPACFAALLGSPGNGRWRIAPLAECSCRRKYRGDSLVLETELTTPEGTVALIDFMPIRDDEPSIVRIVEGRSGTVSIGLTLTVRFDYGSIVPWVVGRTGEPEDDGRFTITATGGADSLTLRSPIPLEGQDWSTVAVAKVNEGDRLPFQLSWHPSHLPPPASFDADASLDATQQWWDEWSKRCRYDGLYAPEVLRSLLTLKGLTYLPTGGIVAAPTTSLPERIGGVRNWDYRYCWLRDATFALNALLDSGYMDEADSWIGWLRRAVAGNPGDLQIMYGVAGERRLTELELDWLHGYEHSAPVRIGNGASGQFQLDVFGEVLDMLHTAAMSGREPRSHFTPDTINLVRTIVEHVEKVWEAPDDGIWEIRGPRRHFVHSKVMAWVAIDRWIEVIEMLELDDEPIDHWRELRQTIHDTVCQEGFNEELGSFTQYYGSDQLDASLLMIGLVGFLPPTDHRLVGTVEAVQRELLVDGFVLRYRSDATAAPSDDTEQAEADSKGAVADTVDGLPPGEGSFLLTTFWLVDSLVLIGRDDEAKQLFERLLSLRNDVGLLAEEYDSDADRMVGNFPQAFSHIGVINSAANLSAAAQHAIGPLTRRAGRSWRG
jgi:GH15 family glucan-1,4-alpha-glucosidase